VSPLVLPLVLPLVVLVLFVEETGAAAAAAAVGLVAEVDDADEEGGAAPLARSEEGSRKLSRLFDSPLARSPEEDAGRSLLARLLLAVAAAAALAPVVVLLVPAGDEGAKGSE
jgi:hypothetical protein